MTEAEYEELSKQADEAAVQGDKEKARHLLESGLADAKEQGDAAFENFFLGELAFLSADYQKALAHYDKAAFARPNTALFLRSSGAALTRLGRHEEALGRIDKAIGLAPGRSDLLRPKGVILSAGGKYKQAREWFEKALAANPNDYHSLREMGSALAHVNRYEEAIEWFDKAIAINPGDRLSLRSKGGALNNLDRPAEAIEWFDKALGINPRDAEALRDKGVSLVNLGKLSQAIGQFDASLAVNARDPRTLAFKATVLSQLGRDEEAFDISQKALAIGADDWQVLSHAGTTLTRLGGYREAIELFDRALKINPKDPQARSNKGTALGGLGRHHESLEWFDKALELDPEDYHALRNRGVALGYLGRYEDAIQCFEKAAAIKPDYYEAIRDKGSALTRLTQYQQALECFDQALALNSKDADALREKAFALHSLDREADALKAAKASLEVEPRNVFARFLALFLEASPKLRTEADNLGVQEQQQLAERGTLRHNLRAWERLTARSAHKIGNQTFAIRGSLRELSLMSLEPEAGAEVRCIEDCLRKIEEFLNEFKSFVGPIRLSLAACDPRDLMRRAATRAGTELRGISLECNFPPQELTVRADHGLMEGIIEELLVNAAKALKGQGKITLGVDTTTDVPAQLLSAGERRPYLVLSVEDDGPGIKPNHAGQIFDPFFSTTAGGTGLGLSLVKKTVEAHGGAIQETGTYGKGAKFEIFLPLKGGDSHVQGSDS